MSVDNLITKKSRIEIWRQIILVSFMVGLSGLVYIFPFQGGFRITLSIVILSILLLTINNLPIFRTILCSGMFVVLFRAIWDSYILNDVNSAILTNLPAIAYYLVYALGFYKLKLRQQNIPSFILLLRLVFIDITANIIELMIRDDLWLRLFTNINEPWPGVIIGMAFSRAFLIILGYQLLINYQKAVLKEDYLRRYTELLILTAKLRAEWFYLKKSSSDIEKVMEKSYILYHELLQKDDHEILATEALAVAREIHEVKKDYTRVIRGLEELLKISPHGGTMRLSEIFFLVEQNTKRYLQQENKQIEVIFNKQNDLATDRYYTLTTILDNLLINSIEASKNGDIIELRQWLFADNLFLEIHDQGCGIKAEDKEYIFRPGYSTKYSNTTGKMSTGIGLCHVENLVCSLQGKIDLISAEPGNTCFRIVIPINNLLMDAIPQKEGE